MQDIDECKAIFFDVDGVVIHPGDRWTRSHGPWFSTVQRDLAIDFLVLSERFFAPGEGTPSLMDECSLGRLDIVDGLSPILRELGYQGSPEDFLTYWFERDAYVDVTLLETVASLRSNHGYRCYLATNQEHRRASYLWEVLELKKHFDGMYYSAKVGHSKKSLEFYRAVEADVDFCGMPIYFDDRESLLRIASQAGWDARLYLSIESLYWHPKLTKLRLRP